MAYRLGRQVPGGLEAAVRIDAALMAEVLVLQQENTVLRP